MTRVAVFQTAAVRKAEAAAAEQPLMQRAGLAAFAVIEKRFKEAKHIAIICGRGNNGGDGYTLAVLLQQRNKKVSLWQVGDHTQLSAEAKAAFLECQKLAIPMRPTQASSDFNHPDLIVDAIAGIGLQHPLKDDVLALVTRINALNCPILALDVPTGIDASTGAMLGGAIVATATITFLGLKLGLCTGSGIAHAGEVFVDNLGVSMDDVSASAEDLQFNALQALLKPRPKDWHKGSSGHVLIVGGDEGYAGAPRMAAEAALRVGSGLVSVATHPSHAALINVNYPELMARGIHEPCELKPLIERADVIVLGPGLGQSAWSAPLWEETLKAEQPLIVDADGLNLLAQHPRQHQRWILTPHPGEAARLLQKSIADISANRLEAVLALANRYGGTAILKGAGTLVAENTGLPGVCRYGNPGMATAGMGDMLSGVLASLVGQGLSLREAARLGVCLHAVAGDHAAKRLGARGMIATDLLPFLRQLSNHEPGT